ncbi:hypothetical protein JCM3774_004890 [Rhodotorula dairenensis]
MSWYPPPPHHYGQPPALPEYGGYPAPPPQQQQQQPQQPHYPGYPPPPPVQQQGYPYYAQPPPPVPAPGYYAAGGYAQQPRYDSYSAPPPPAHHHHQYSPPPPATVPAGPPASIAQPSPPPLKEGELRPPPDVAHDPNSFRRYFKQQLDHLTYNSKPVITSLTLFAHEHAIRMATVVAQCFDEHLRTCPPQYLLPAFYLLDSICKNIGAPYLALFSRFIERAFLSAYHAVDPVTRTKLEELLGTWKTGGPDGGELFRDADEPMHGARVQRGIEAALFGARGRGDGFSGRATKDSEMYHAGVQQLPHTATTTERSGVLYDVRRLLTLRQDALASHPSDQINASQITALKKLEQLILNTQLTTEQVTQIRNQLAALAPPPTTATTGRSAASASPAPVPAASLSPPAGQQPQPPLMAGQSAYAASQPRHLSPPAPAAHSPQFQQQQHQRFSPAPPAPLAAAAAVGSPALVPALAHGSTPTPTLTPAHPAGGGGGGGGGLVNGIDLGLLSQLSASGALANLFGGSGSTGGGAGGSGSPALANAKVEAKPDLVKAEDGALGPNRREKVPLVERDEMAPMWEQEVIRMGVTLNSGDLATPRPHALALLYLQMVPLQCRQCGLRQPDSRTGKRKMDEHLDWHFVHKRRMREAAGRASGRSWFTSEEDWYTSDATHHPLSAADQPSASLLSAGAAAAASQAGNGAIDRAALQKLKVAVPAAESGEAELGLGDKPCPICQDRFKSEWSDEEEEWVWWNAVVVDKVLYHATCHAETALSRSNAATASRTSVRTSRESTPALAAAAAAAANSRKRKADSVDPIANATTSPLKPKPEGDGLPSAQNGDASAGVRESEGAGGTSAARDEPDPKRVKAEPQEEEERGALVSALNDTAPVEQAAQRSEGNEQPPVGDIVGDLDDSAPVHTSTGSSLFLPE